MKETLDKILEEFEKVGPVLVVDDADWLPKNKTRNFISQKFPTYTKEFEAGEKSMAKGVLRRIKSGKSLEHIGLLCKAVAEEELKI